MNLNLFILFRENCLTVCVEKDNVPVESKVFLDNIHAITTTWIKGFFNNVSRAHLNAEDKVDTCSVVSDNSDFTNIFSNIVHEIFQPVLIFGINQNNFSLGKVGDEEIKKHWLSWERGLNIFRKFEALGGTAHHSRNQEVIGTVSLEFGDKITVMILSKKGLFLTFFQHSRDLTSILKQIVETAKSLVKKAEAEAEAEDEDEASSSNGSYKVSVNLVSASASQLETVTEGLKDCPFILPPQRTNYSIYRGIKYAAEMAMLDHAVFHPASPSSSSNIQNLQRDSSLEPSPSPSVNPDAMDDDDDERGEENAVRVLSRLRGNDDE